MPCQFPGCKISTPTDWCLRHGKHYSTVKPTSKPQQPLSIPELIERAQKVFNRWIRDRDRSFGCITCHLSMDDASHYIPIGENASLRFNEDNCHGQCAKENRIEYGNRNSFRKALINKIGLERVEALETSPKYHKYSRQELQNIIEKYSSNSKEKVG